MINFKDVTYPSKMPKIETGAICYLTITQGSRKKWSGRVVTLIKFIEKGSPAAPQLSSSGGWIISAKWLPKTAKDTPWIANTDALRPIASPSADIEEEEA